MSFKSGTGFTKWIYDYPAKKIEINFDGICDDQCYRNDASLLFFCANSYRKAYLIIEDELGELFDDCSNNSSQSKSNLKQISHLILPYYFNFRHFLELELKALISSIDDCFPVATHSLIQLVDSFGESLMGIREQKRYGELDESKDNDLFKEIIEEYTEIMNLVEQYQRIESASDYYRYLFEKRNKRMVLRNPNLTLELNETKQLFGALNKKLMSISIHLREVGVYVYFTL